MPPSAPLPGPPLAERRLCFVLGKGGAGKSAAAAALALASARAGRRTLLIEVAGQRRMSRVLGGPPPGHDRPAELAPGLFGLSIEAERATEEYLASQLRVRPLVEVLVRSRAFHHFAAAAPGLAELVTVGKIWTLAIAMDGDGRGPVWDRLVVDCPATGHALALLETAANVEDLAATGPIRDQAARIQEVISHPAATGIAVVARPEELAVVEAVEASAALRERGLPVAAAIMNAIHPPRFAEDDLPALQAAAAAGDGAARAAAEAALRRWERERADREHRRRLAEGTGLPVIDLPAVVRRRFDRAAIETLADALPAPPDGAGVAA